MLKHRQYIYFYFFSRATLNATLNETFTGKYVGVLPITPQVRPKSEIHTPKRDDEYPHPFHIGSPPRAQTSLECPPPSGVGPDRPLWPEKKALCMTWSRDQLSVNTKIVHFWKILLVQAKKAYKN